jgi:hypothetical protein
MFAQNKARYHGDQNHSGRGSFAGFRGLDKEDGASWLEDEVV